MLRLVPAGGGASRRFGPGGGDVGGGTYSGEISSGGANLVPSWPAGLAFYAASLVTTVLVGLARLEQQPGSLAIAPRSARLAGITTATFFATTEALASPTLATGQLPAAPTPTPQRPTPKPQRPAFTAIAGASDAAAGASFTAEPLAPVVAPGACASSDAVLRC